MPKTNNGFMASTYKTEADILCARMSLQMENLGKTMK